MKEHRIEELTDKDIQSLINNKPLVFVGSAISMFEPTNLLSGVRFCHAIYEYIFFDPIFSKDENKWLREEFNNIPFEALMECAPNKGNLPCILSGLFRVDTANNFHECLADRVLDGTLQGIITPNYDLAFDSAFHQSGFRNIVRNYDDYNKLSNLESAYFKIHGTAEATFENTLVYTLSQEGTLTDWKDEFLRKLICDKVIIVLGYSGRDFDICPIISSLNNYKKVVWLQYADKNEKKEPLSAYALHLLNSNDNNELIIGDFEKFTKLFFKLDLQLNIGRSDFNAASIFQLSCEELYEWQLNILNRMACASLGLPILLNANTMLAPTTRTYLLSEMYGNTGEYAKAAKASLELSKQYSSNSREYILALNSISRFWLYFGRYISSYKYIVCCKKLSENHPNDIILKTTLLAHELSFYMRMYQILRFVLPPIARLILKKAKTIKNESLKLKVSGAWDDRQMIQHSLERLGLAKDSDLSLPPYIGFNNLGLPGMGLIAYRDKIRYNKWENNEEPMQYLSECIDKAENLGMYTELWKLCRLKIKKAMPNNKSEATNIWKKWRENLTFTEYALPRFIFTRIDLYFTYLKIKFTYF